MSPRAADVERLIERAGKVSRCIYIAVEPEVADDVSGVIRDLVEALRALGAARESEVKAVQGEQIALSPPSSSTGGTPTPATSSELSPAAREGLDRVLDGYRLAETLLAARRAVADVRAYVERLVAEAASVPPEAQR